ncbi:hypothetical protein [Nostoc sp. UHCC 0870]|uniref:hypothetical protein n=1 Tax=Nostoc sp. UHCC 0870 TaxID=2914041 RepID=UPI001EDE3C4E|nr:hypothetical protein [Nostoc sp. UHCC 0870]UKP00133.1 hypothetical protein L6494_10720 [Nostoc sp. UHCC 0870]
MAHTPDVTLRERFQRTFRYAAYSCGEASYNMTKKQTFNYELRITNYELRIKK